MKAKQISETTLKITISMNDLEERGMELADFIMPQEKTEEFFYNMLDEVEMPEHFKMGGMLSFRVTPKNDRIDIFVTRSEVSTDFQMDDLSKLEELAHLSPEEFFKHIEQEMTEKGDHEALKRLAEAEAADEASESSSEDGAETETEAEEVMDYVHYVLSFEALPDVIRFAQKIDYPVEAAELYKYKGQYRLTVLIYVEDQPKTYPDMIYARLLEHAKEARETRAFLREHAVLLQEGDVLDALAQVSGV